MIMSGIVVVLLAAGARSGSAAETPAWVEAQGEAYQGDVETPKEVMERARRSAEDRAIEEAQGMFIRAHALVSNGQVAEDLVYASVRGRIERVEPVEEGWDQKDRKLYRVRLRALVSPVYPERGREFAIKLSLSKADLKEGEEVKVLYQSSLDCCVYIFSVAADGSVTLLLPNQVHKENRIVAGKGYQFPPPDSPIRLEARLLPGNRANEAEERVKIVATRSKEDLVALGFQEGFFKAYDARSTAMISDLVKRLNQIDAGDWAEATALYTIKK